MSDYEQIVLTKLFMESMCNRSRFAEIYGLDRTRVGRIITKWAPRWGKFGERPSILPMPHDYFHKESPIEYDALQGKQRCMLDARPVYRQTADGIKTNLCFP